MIPIPVMQFINFFYSTVVDNVNILKINVKLKHQFTAHFEKNLLKGIYFVIYGIISELTDKGQFQYLTNLKGPQEETYLYTTQFLSLR